MQASDISVLGCRTDYSILDAQNIKALLTHSCPVMGSWIPTPGISSNFPFLVPYSHSPTNPVPRSRNILFYGFRSCQQKNSADMTIIPSFSDFLLFDFRFFQVSSPVVLRDSVARDGVSVRETMSLRDVNGVKVSHALLTMHVPVPPNLFRICTSCPERGWSECWVRRVWFRIRWHSETWHRHRSREPPPSRLRPHRNSHHHKCLDQACHQVLLRLR